MNSETGEQPGLRRWAHCNHMHLYQQSTFPGSWSPSDRDCGRDTTGEEAGEVSNPVAGFGSRGTELPSKEYRLPLEVGNSSKERRLQCYNRRGLNPLNDLNEQEHRFFPGVSKDHRQPCGSLDVSFVTLQTQIQPGPLDSGPVRTVRSRICVILNLEVRDCLLP